MKINEFILEILQRGYTVRLKDGRYLITGNIFKYETLYGWNKQDGWFVGMVSTHGPRGSWVVMPVEINRFDELIKSYSQL